jgi:SAM-dependent methyltransferase
MFLITETKKFLHGLRKRKNIVGEFECSVCQATRVGMDPLPMYYFGKYQKYGFIHNIFLTETINFQYYSCKNCGSSDRDRLYALYFKKYLVDKENINLLDIAPAGPLETFLRGQSNITYRSMDLMMENVDDKVDITNMKIYKDGQFDFFICSHVLEHIPDDIKAMEELYRILKSGGKGIAMVPINLGLDSTMEDPTCTDIPARWKLFGQHDHVRMYAKNDFINRLADVGFGIEMLDIGYFGSNIFAKTAIYPTSVLYIVTK